MLNWAARLIFNLRRSYHVFDALISLHWLRVPERIRSKVAVLVYKVLHGGAPSHLAPFTYVADLPSRRGLRSSCNDCLVQLPVLHSTVGSRAFSVAGPQVRYELPVTGGYVGTVSGDLPYSTQDVPVYGIISWHSTDLTFCFYTLSIVDLAASLNT